MLHHHSCKQVLLQFGRSLQHHNHRVVETSITKIKSNILFIFYSPHKIHIVYAWYICTYTNNCLMLRASREVRLIMLLALRYHTCSSPVPGPDYRGPPDPSAGMAIRRPALQRTRGRQVTRRPQRHEDGRTTPSARRSRSMFRANYGNNLIIDSLIPCVARSLTTMRLKD